MYMAVAIGAIGIAVVLMIGYIVLAQVKTALPTPQSTYVNSCYHHPYTSPTYCNTTAVPCGPTLDNTSTTITCANSQFAAGTNSLQVTAFAGLGLLAVGIIVLAAFAIIKMFQ